MQVDLLHKEVAGERVELKELKKKLSGARNKMNDSRASHGCETRRKAWIENIVNGCPICNKDFATVEKLEASSTA
ncbi:hypothetical protein BYT27DRAFT_6650490 [Phlegmacium glaucopus]|nr:hypothetical protein BYT27DRAFT_6650490 [Phlegmacium glaucopus]